MFKALLLEKTEAGFQAGIRELDEAALPEGDVLLQVEHSTLNYKDGLAITNRGPVVRSWPMVAGIDGAGTVLESSHAQWKAGDKVKITIMFRGREQSRPEAGIRLLQRLADEVADISVVESAPRQDGRNMTMVLGPDKKAQAAYAAELKKAEAEAAAQAAAEAEVATPAPTPVEADTSSETELVEVEPVEADSSETVAAAIE